MPGPDRTPATVLVHVNLSQDAVDNLELMSGHYGLSVTDLIDQAVLNLTMMATGRADDWYRVSKEKRLQLLRGHGGEERRWPGL